MLLPPLATQLEPGSPCIFVVMGASRRDKREYGALVAALQGELLAPLLARGQLRVDIIGGKPDDRLAGLISAGALRHLRALNEFEYLS